MTFLVINFTFSQEESSLSSKLGGIPTDFLFTSSNVPITTLQQFIIKAAIINVSTASEKSYGYGTETFWLEIETEVDIPFIHKKLFERINGYQLKLFDKYEKPLGTFIIPNSQVKRAYNTARRVHNEYEEVFFYGFNLSRIPLGILNKTHRIDIEKYVY